MMLLGMRNPDGARDESSARAKRAAVVRWVDFVRSGMLLRVRAAGWSGPWTGTPAPLEDSSE